jgi:Uma2 family endonuclease
MSVRFPLTTADLDLMPDDGHRYELLEGELVVSRAPRLSHQRISGNIFTTIRTYLENNPVGEVFATPGIVFENFDSVIPDLVWVSYARQERIVVEERFVAAPELVIEIVSPGESNVRRDRVNKRHIYGRFGVDEYWIVDPVEQTVECYNLEEDVLVLRTTSHIGDDLDSEVLPSFRCPVARIFRH